MMMKIITVGSVGCIAFMESAQWPAFLLPKLLLQCLLLALLRPKTLTPERSHGGLDKLGYHDVASFAISRRTADLLSPRLPYPSDCLNAHAALDRAPAGAQRTLSGRILQDLFPFLLIDVSFAQIQQNSVKVP